VPADYNFGRRGFAEEAVVELVVDTHKERTQTEVLVVVCAEAILTGTRKPLFYANRRFLGRHPGALQRCKPEHVKVFLRQGNEQEQDEHSE